MADPHIAATPRIKSSTMEKFIRSRVEPDLLIEAKYFRRAMKTPKGMPTQDANT